jgi:uncharacterized protein YeaO (DUF488 family)
MLAVSAGLERPPMLKTKRIYEPASPTDGYRVLVDRLWPRGVAKDAAHLDEWLREIAPSDELRKWFGHDPTRWPEFARRYRDELAAPDKTGQIERLRALTADRTVTLLFAARDEAHNNAVVIADIVGDP